MNIKFVLLVSTLPMYKGNKIWNGAREEGSKQKI